MFRKNIFIHEKRTRCHKKSRIKNCTVLKIKTMKTQMENSVEELEDRIE